MLEAIFRRVADLSLEGHSEVFDVGRLGDLLRDTVRRGKIDPVLSVKVNDAHAWAAIDAWQDSDDKVLSSLAHRLLGRQFFKTIEIPDAFRRLVVDNWARLEDVVRECGLDPKYNLALDTTINRAFAPYAPPTAPLLPFISPTQRRHPNADIRICQPDGAVVSIQEASPIVEMLTRVNSQVARLCFPAAAREKIAATLRDIGSLR